MTTNQDRMDARMTLDLAVEDIESAVRKLNEYCDITGNKHFQKTFVAGLEYFIGTGGWLGHDATAESLRKEMDEEQRIADENSCEICGEDDSEGGMGEVIEMFYHTESGERIERNVHLHCGEYRNMEVAHLKDIVTLDGDPDICELCGEQIEGDEIAEMGNPDSSYAYTCHSQCGLDRGLEPA
jgi:hypothetical protein